AASVLELTAARPGNIDDARVCASDNLRSCTLRDGVAIFAVDNPEIGGDSAVVVVKAMWLGNLTKQPVQDGIFRVTLRRDATGWKAVSARTLNIS
ncbi:hypothetical protein, partial [Longimicrobium sp.]|uniref:hypothetical protein n=1 Tax=Longimicrobium sp. TaxID=2029185 RepID=UPI002E30CDB6